MDETFRKLQNSQDARGPKGRMARGNNIYKGGLPNPTPVGTNSRTGKKSKNADQITRLAQLRMKGVI